MPAQWQGSVEHFYHFLLGYFVPLALWQDKTGETTFTVRDCGPMNAWFELLHPDTHLNHIAPGVMLERFLSHRQNRVVLRAWDDPHRFHPSSLRRASEIIRTRTNGLAAESAGQRIVVIDRRAPLPFYNSNRAEVPGSAATERSVPNMADIAELLEQRFGNVDFVDLAEETPSNQVATFAKARIVVGQHGAGLANTLWLPKNAALLEIKPPLQPIIGGIFENLCAAKRVDYVSLPQDSHHAPVNLQSVARRVDILVEQSGGLIPSMSAHPLTRVRRALVRQFRY